MPRRLQALLLSVLWLLAACAPPAAVATSTSTPPPATPTATPTSPPPTATSTLVRVARPFPQHVRLAPGSILPDRRTRQQMDDDVRAFYEVWKATYLLEAGLSSDGHPLYRVAFAGDEPGSDTTVSEGQGYGMLIVPLMAGYDPDAQMIFDGLWAFSRLHPSEVDARLMDWNVPDTELGNDSAFDGDADMAYGLLLADTQWGSDGRLDYMAEAQTLIGGMLESTIGPESHLPMLGDWIDPTGEDYSQYTPRSSDFMLVNFRAFGKATGDPVWSDVVRQSQAVMAAIQEAHSPATGLMPDFIIITGEDHLPEPSPPFFLEGPNDGHYSYNAGRVPWRVGADVLLHNDAASRAIVQRISTWAESVTGGDPAELRAGYDLDGNPVAGSDYFTTFFAAPLGVAAMTDPGQQDWLNAIYDTVHAQHEDYYEDSVTLLCLLVMSGNAWSP